MNGEIFGEKVVHIVAAILAAVASAAGISLAQVEQANPSPESSAAVEPRSVAPAESGGTVSQNKQESSSSGAYTLENGITIHITPAPSGGKIAGPISITGTVPSSVGKTRLTIRLIDPSGNVLHNGSMTVSGGGSGGAATTFSTSLNVTLPTSGMGSLEISSDAGGIITIPIEF